MNKMQKSTIAQAGRRIVAGLAVFLFATLVITMFGGRNTVHAAACTAPSTDFGAATTSVTLPANATYRVWTRMMVPDTSNNTYLLELDGNQCFTVGGNNMQANSWVWIPYQSSGTNNKIDLALTAGSHGIKLIGNKADVKIDRLIFASDLACTPTGDGTNCNQPTETPISIKLTAPTDGATVKNTVTLSADVTGTATKVEFYVNSALVNTDTTAPYSYNWDSATVQSGNQYLIAAKAYNAAGSTAVDSFMVTVQNGDETAPSTPTNVKASAEAYNKVNVAWSPSTDNVGVTGYTVFRNGLPVKTVAGTTFTDTDTLPDTSYYYQVQATDAAGNKSAISARVDAATVKTPQLPDTQAPTAPSGLSATAVSPSQINLVWTVSTDNIGVAAYDIYRDGCNQESHRIATISSTAYGDTGLKQKTAYTYCVVARDSAGNKSSASAEASATTQNHSSRRGVIKGVISDKATGKPLSRTDRTTATVNIGRSKHIYTANRKGMYTIPRLGQGTYNVSYRARGHTTVTINIAVEMGAVITKNVALPRR